MTTTPATFQTGRTYLAHWATDHTMQTPFEVVRRTARFVTLRRPDTGETVRVGVKADHAGAEYALPFGTYSMAPVLRAERLAS